MLTLIPHVEWLSMARSWRPGADSLPTLEEVGESRDTRPREFGLAGRGVRVVRTDAQFGCVDRLTRQFGRLLLCGHGVDGELVENEFIGMVEAPVGGDDNRQATDLGTWMDMLEAALFR